MIKKRLFTLAAVAGLSTLGFSLPGHAALPGFYLGTEAGMFHSGANSDNVTPVGTTPPTISSVTVAQGSGAVGSFLGYQFNNNWAIEAGGLFFAHATIKGVAVVPEFPEAKFPFSESVGATNVLYTVGKGILPLSDTFSAFGKLGLGYVRSTTTQVGFNGIIPVYTSVTHNKVVPVFGAGVSYDITPNIPVELSWMHVQKSGNVVPNTDLALLGISYHFG
jgi:OOP family OmpA-OmpF porin